MADEGMEAGTTTIQVDRVTEIIDSVKIAYNMEIETAMNYLANAANLDGVRAEEIKDALEADIQTELGHAKKLAERIHIMGGVVPGSQELSWNQRSLQPKMDLTDVPAVIRGVIEAENAACKHYQKIIDLTDGIDWVTQDLCIQLLADEEAHRREFTGFLKEYERK
jgi:bacterioferritin